VFPSRRIDHSPTVRQILRALAVAARERRGRGYQGARTDFMTQARLESTQYLPPRRASGNAEVFGRSDSPKSTGSSNPPFSPSCSALRSTIQSIVFCTFWRIARNPRVSAPPSSYSGGCSTALKRWSTSVRLGLPAPRKSSRRPQILHPPPARTGRRRQRRPATTTDAPAARVHATGWQRTCEQKS
jgi:hypothetical protein